MKISQICYKLPNLATLLFNCSAYKEKRDEYIRKLNGIYQNNLDKSKVELIKGKAKFIGNFISFFLLVYQILHILLM